MKVQKERVLKTKENAYYFGKLCGSNCPNSMRNGSPLGVNQSTNSNRLNQFLTNRKSFRSSTHTTIKKYKLLMFLTILMLLLLVLVFFSFPKNEKSDDAVVFTLNGESVTDPEFEMVMSSLRGNVFSYFAQTYEAKDSETFWTSSFGGEVPIDVLKEKTVDILKKIKVEQLLMRSNGIVDDISFKGYMEKLNAENEQRKQAVAKKQPIYGPIQYEAESYYEMLHENRREQLVKKLAKTVLIPTEAEIKSAYNATKETKYKNADTIKYEIVSVSYGSENTSAELKSNAMLLALRIRENEKKGSSLSSIVSSFQKQGETGLTYNLLSSNESDYKVTSRRFPVVSQSVNELNEGELSGIIEENFSFEVIKVINKKPGELYTLDHVKEQVEKEVVDEKYAELVNDLLQKADVKLDKEVYDRIQ